MSDQQGYGYPPPAAQYAMGPVQQQPGYGGGVTVVQAPPKPDNHMVFSVFVCLCCNWICGLFGIYYASQTDSAYNTGNYQQAQEHSRQAKKCAMIGLICGIIGLVIGVILIIVYFTVFIGMFAAAASQNNNNNWNNNWDNNWDGSG